MELLKVENMLSKYSENVPNQFIIKTSNGLFFQSYETIIAFIPNDGETCRISKDWNFSNTTRRYLCSFLSDNYHKLWRVESKKEIVKAIKDGFLEVVEEVKFE